MKEARQKAEGTRQKAEGRRIKSFSLIAKV
jgi:hypothetical protein